MNTFIIAAVGRDGAIGQAGGLPWGRLQHERRWFSRITRSALPRPLVQNIIAGAGEEPFHEAFNAVIMGRKTWESFPDALPGRFNIVLSRLEGGYVATPGVLARSLEEALVMARSQYSATNAFIIGGAGLYAEALRSPMTRAMFMTEIDHQYPEADVHFPGIGPVVPWEDCSWIDVGEYGETLLWTRTRAGEWMHEGNMWYRLALWERG